RESTAGSISATIRKGGLSKGGRSAHTCTSTRCGVPMVNLTMARRIAPGNDYETRQEVASYMGTSNRIAAERERLRPPSNSLALLTGWPPVSDILRGSALAALAAPSDGRIDHKTCMASERS